MSKIIKLASILALVLCLASLSFGQTVTLTTTTLSAALAATDKVVCLTSATGVVVRGVGVNGSKIYVDQELLTVVSTAAEYGSTCYNVNRGDRPVGHAILAPVYIGAANNFYTYSPSGTCTTAGMAVRPWINVSSGAISDCPSTKWIRIGGPDQAVTAQWCGTTNTCAATGISQTMKVAAGQSAQLNAASPSVATITGISPAFSTTTSFSCTASPQGTGATTNAIAVNIVSTSSITLTGANGSSAVVNWLCVGY